MTRFSVLKSDRGDDVAGRVRARVDNWNATKASGAACGSYSSLRASPEARGRVNWEQALARLRSDVRAATIAVAREAFYTECSMAKVICSEAAFVSTFLRDRDQDPLSEKERVRLGIRSGDEPLGRATGAASNRAAPANRLALIAAARRGLAAERTTGKLVICSERAWINSALRDDGQALLTESECVAHSVPVDE